MVKIAAIGSVAGLVGAMLVTVLGPVRPRGFTGGDGTTFQWARRESDGGSLTPHRPALCDNQSTEHSHIMNTFTHNFTRPTR